MVARHRCIDVISWAAVSPQARSLPAARAAQSADNFTILGHRVHQQVASDATRPGGDVTAGMVRAVTFEGSLRALPIRHATAGLFYNEELFAERGISGPPTTMEELIDHAQRLTYTRSDVNGFAFQGNSHFNMLTMVFGFDAPLIDAEMRLLPNEAGMTGMFETLRAMFERGVLPRNFAAMGQEDVFTMIQTGRVAMALALASLKERAPLVATSDFWSMTIPRNAKNKPLTWSLMRELASKDATIRQALNGNGPVRASAYAADRLISRAPYAAVEARVLPLARPPLLAG